MMPDESDQTLLQEFARSRSPGAMEALVRRHGAWVYATCLREVRETHLAEDVAQSVFLILMRKAATMNPRQNLTGWLFNTCRYASANALKMQRRRRRHEQDAAAARPAADASPPAPESDERIGVVNECIGKLKRRDRDAILIRFFRDGSNADVAAALGISESAARTCVSRALDRLRRVFAKRRVTLTEAGLTTLLAIKPAPSSEFAGAVLKAVIHPSAATARQLAITKGTINMMMLTKVKIAVVLVLAIALLGAGGVKAVADLAGGAAPAKLSAPALADLPKELLKGRVVRQLEVTRDTMALAYLPDWEHGEVDNLAVANNDGGVRDLIDWPAPAAADIGDPQTHIYLALYSRKTTSNPGPGQIGACEILEDWNETAAPWNHLPATSAKPFATFDFQPGDGWKLFDVTELIRSQIAEKRTAHGIMLRFLQENVRGNRWSGYSFISREGASNDASLRPRLVIVDEAGGL